MEPEIKIEDYNYELPEERIAKFPLDERDQSKILIYKDGAIGENIFSNLPELLPDGSLMVFNSTKVVPARLIFKKDTGARIEIFCLEPYSPADYNLSFAAENSCEWIVAVGNAKRWRGEEIGFDCRDIDDVKALNLRASIITRREEDYIVKFAWDAKIPFSNVLELCGNIPIPPYLKRDTQEIDHERYQTLYARVRGSVAAPTAGLHFSGKVLDKLKDNGIGYEELILHVGAGTFRPVKSQYIAEHKMHSEPFTVSRRFLEVLLNCLKSRQNIIAVGTTSTRVLESLYYLGLQIARCGAPGKIEQWEPYRSGVGSLDCGEYTGADSDVEASIYSIGRVVEWMDKNGIDHYSGNTEILIAPGYKFKIVDILITNFHQPQSTLLLLISAFIGERWRDIYKYAINNNFRFLSYGDSSILFGCRQKM